MQRIGISTAGLVMSLLVLGCGAYLEGGVPADMTTYRSPQGFPAATYDLGPPQRNLGTATVWSNGAYYRAIQGQRKPLIHVGFVITSYSDEPMSLPLGALALDTATLGQPIARNLPLAMMEGITTIRPRATQQIDLHFALPPDTDPRDVDALQVRWTLRAGDTSYIQRTPFLRNRADQRRIAYFYTPSHDPFLFDPYLFHPEITIRRHAYRPGARHVPRRDMAPRPPTCRCPPRQPTCRCPPRQPTPRPYRVPR